MCRALRLFLSKSKATAQATITGTKSYLMSSRSVYDKYRITYEFSIGAARYEGTSTCYNSVADMSPPTYDAGSTIDVIYLTANPSVNAISRNVTLKALATAMLFPLITAFMILVGIVSWYVFHPSGS